MKNTFCTLFIVSSIIYSCNSALNQNKFHNKTEFKGKVKKVIQTQNTLVEVIYFDTTGKDTALYSFNKDGSLFL